MSSCNIQKYLINVFKVITVNNHYKPFFFCLTWFFVFSSAHSADMAVDMKAGETKKPEQAESKKADTQWAMGIGLGVFDYHLYPGAKQSNRLIFPDWDATSIFIRTAGIPPLISILNNER